MMTRRIEGRMLAAVLVAASLVMAACGGDDAPSLDGTSWTLAPSSLDVEVPPEAEVTIAFTADTAAGRSGCNNFTGSYTTDGDGGIDIGPLAGTRMACVPGIDAVEAAVLDRLDRAAGYTIDDDELVLEDDAGDELLRFTPTS
jgi:heat shock protein HslJ